MRNDTKTTQFQPKISVIIPAYNREKTIGTAIKSVIDLLSLHKLTYEILVVDDGSKDSTVKEIQALQKNYSDTISLIQIPHSGKPAIARNAGLKIAKGEYIAFQDSDDVWKNYDITSRMKCFDDPNVVLSYGNAEYFGNLTLLKKHFVPKGTGLEGKSFFKLISRFHTPIPTPTVIIRKSLIETMGAFNTALTHAEDVEFWIRASLHGDLHYFSEICALIRRDGTNLSSLYSEKGDEALFAHEEANIEVLYSIAKIEGLSIQQKRALEYRVLEMKSEYDKLRLNKGMEPIYKIDYLPKIPTELKKLEDKYKNSPAGIAHGLLKMLSFGNERLYLKLKKGITVMVRPFRRYV